MTRTKIKEIALNLFAQKGYEGTALSEIAAAVGIKTPSIYGHFSSKEGLMLEIWHDLMADYHNLMEGLLKEAWSKPTEEQLRELISGYGQYFKQHPDSYYLWARMLMFPPPEFQGQALQDCLAEETYILGKITELLAAAVEQGQIKPAPVPDLLNAFIVLKEGYVQWLVFYNQETADRQLDRLWPLFWNGLANN